MIEKVLNTFHDRQNEVENFIFMIEKFKKENHSNDDFLNLLEQISENNLKTFSDFEQKTASKMLIVFNELI